MSTMMIRKRRILPETSDSSDEDSPQRRKHLRSATVEYNDLPKDNAFASIPQTDVKTNNNVSCSSKLSIKQRRQRRNKVPISSSSEHSSSSEDEVILHPARRGSLRALSDYETGDSTGSGKAHGSQLNCTSVEDNHQNVCHNNNNKSYNDIDLHSDSSGDESIIQAVYRRRTKRDVQPICTTDSSDSGVPIGFQRKKKRMKLIMSSEESDSSNLTTVSAGRRLEEVNEPQTSNHCISKQENNEQMGQKSDDPEYNVTSINLRGQKSYMNNIHSNNIEPTTSSSGSVINMVQWDNESSHEASTDNDSDIRPRVIQRRSVNLFTDCSDSEDNGFTISVSSGLSDSDESIPPRITRSRRNGSHSQALSLDELDSEDSIEIRTSRRGRNRLQALSYDELYSDDSIPMRITRSISNATQLQAQSQDEQDSDDSIQMRSSRFRRNRLRALSADEIDSDESIQVCRPRTNRLRALSDLSDDEQVNSSVVTYRNTDPKKNSNSGNSSESDGESERCPICLAKFIMQEIGIPTTCDHKFCATCLQTWARSNNTCPVDRRLFNSIVIRNHFEGTVVRQISIETPAVRADDNEDESSDEQLLYALIRDIDIDVLGVEEDIDIDVLGVEQDSSDGDGPDEVCCICDQNDRSDVMIVCDACDDVYHMDCVDPPLHYVPVTDWYCPNCTETVVGVHMVEYD